MAVSFALEEDLYIARECADRVKNYLLGGANQDSRRFVKRSVSTSSDEETDPRDPEQPANVRDWSFAEQTTSSTLEGEESPLGWISQCSVTTYNCLDFLLLVNQQRFALLTRSASNDKEFEIGCLKELDYQLGFDKDDCITCGCLFGLGTHRISEALDCLIVALGMTNGYVIFYTERGTLLFFEQFSESEILWVTFDQAVDNQQLTVVCAKDFFAVDPISLHSTLLKAKAALARGEKTAEELSKTLEVDVDRLRPERGKGGLRNVLHTGTHRMSAFEQYSTASLISYHETISSAAPPPYSTYLYATDRVFSTFAWTTEADRKKIWTEAIKYGKSFVPHFGFRDMLGIGKTPRKKAAVAEASHVVTTRGTLGDSRLVVEAALERTRGLVAVVDHIARVVLIDVKNRQIVRIWKGYRDATVAWVSSSNDNQNALFLAIFSPRRGLLEVWNVQGGVRVGAVHVDPVGVLLDGGASSVLCGTFNSNNKRDAFFVNSQGKFSRLIVPFHLSMLRITSQDQHDQLLLSKFSSSSDMESFMDVYSSLKMLKYKRELILLTLPLIDDPVRLEGMLDGLPKTDNVGPVEELIVLIRRLLTAYNNVVKYNKQDTIRPDELPYVHLSDDVQEVIRRHCVHEEGSKPINMVVGNFLEFIDCRSPTGALWGRNYPDADLLHFGEFLFAPALQGRVDVETYVNNVLDPLPFALDEFCELLPFVYTRSHSKVGAVGFASICMLLMYFEQRRPGTLEKCERTALECANISRALLLFAACCVVKLNLPQKEDGESRPMDDNTLMSGGDDWEPVNPSLEHADCIILTMHAAFLTCQLNQPVPFVRIINCARAFFREQVAVFVAREQWNPQKLEEAFSSSKTLAELRSLLPRTLRQSLLCCDIAWELMSMWFKDTSQYFGNFELALRYLDVVDDCRIRHGVLALMWQNFIMDRFKALILLIEKTGRAPKEREARQQLQMRENCVVEFLTRCHELLKMLMDDVRDSPPPSAVQQDHLIEIAQAHPPANIQLTSRDSLAELAARQPLVNYYLVLHHYHLAVAAAIQLSAGLRSHILRVLFCQIGQRAFFLPLDSHPLIPLEEVDDAVTERRHQFIAKVAEQGTENDRRFARLLSLEWNLTVDTIQITQVLCFLRAGHDAAAGREMAGIVQTEHLAQTMARILAARTLHLAEEENTVLTAAHLSFLNSTAGDEKMRVDCSNTTWKDAVISFGKIIAGLSLQPQFAAPFIRIGGITSQYWGIHILE